MKQENKHITMTMDDLEEFGRGIVVRTMVEMGYKPSQFQLGRIGRMDMIAILGSRRRYEVAVMSGRLRIHKGGSKTSRVWASRSDWEKFLRDHTNKKF